MQLRRLHLPSEKADSVPVNAPVGPRVGGHAPQPQAAQQSQAVGWYGDPRPRARMVMEMDGSPL